MAHRSSQGNFYRRESAVVLTLIALVLVGTLRLGNVEWQHIILVAVFIPMIVAAVRHGQKDRLDAQRLLRHQATHDLLTGLPNRVLFQERLLASMQRRTCDCRFALALLDLDGFKAVNDQHGHLTGDLLLQAIAQRLRDNLRASDTVARLGGDEFALILNRIADVAVLFERCNQLRELLSRPLELEDGSSKITVKVGVSIGIAIGTDLDTQSLLKRADWALYRAKAEGKNNCVLIKGQIVEM